MTQERGSGTQPDPHPARAGSAGALTQTATAPATTNPGSSSRKDLPVFPSLSTMSWTPAAADLFDPARAAAAGRGPTTPADVLTALPTLAWVELGDGRTDPADPAAVITALARAEDAACAEGYHRPADPGAAIGRLIGDLGLRRVTRAAWNARVPVHHPTSGTTFQDPLYGVECAYTDGLLRLYALDLTSHPGRWDCPVVAAEFTPHP